jgi:catalase
LPINRPVAPFHNGQRDAQHRTVIDKGARPTSRTRSMAAGRKKPHPPRRTAASRLPERIDANKIRQRSESFSDHFSQARLFFNSMSQHEKEHIIAAYSFELGKVEREFIRARQVNEILANIDLELAKRVGNLGLPAPKQRHGRGAKTSFDHSPALSQANLLPGHQDAKSGDSCS